MRNDGGPAFPTVRETHPASTGMSIRDWFAGQALVGMLAYPGDHRGSWQSNSNRHDVAEQAYEYADAMLAERGKA